jgi:hypothetical protein
VRSIANDGLLQRFQLLVYPVESKEWKLVDEYPNHTEKNRAFKVIETLAAMDFVQCGATHRKTAHRFHISSSLTMLRNFSLAG